MKISKMKNNSFDFDKRIILCGKGETAHTATIAEKENCYIACLNTSALLFQEVDFLFFNDIETVAKIENAEKGFDRIRNIVIPLQLHSKEVVSSKTYLDVAEHLKEEDTNIYTYKLHTQTMKSPDNQHTDILRFGPEPIYSTYHSALFWLTECGFKEFDIYGVSKTGKYEKTFENTGDTGNERNLNWYEINYEIGLSILRRNNCKFKIN